MDTTNEYNLALGRADMHFGLTVSGGFCLFSTSISHDFVNFNLYSSSKKLRTF